MTNFSIILW